MPQIHPNHTHRTYLLTYISVYVSHKEVKKVGFHCTWCTKRKRKLLSALDVQNLFQFSSLSLYEPERKHLNTDYLGGKPIFPILSISIKYLFEEVSSEINSIGTPPNK